MSATDLNVRHVARLARLALTDEEIATFEGQLGRVLEHIEHLWDIRGSRDLSRKLGPLAFPGRWPFARGSAWHHALADGRVTVLDGGPVHHDGRGAYFEGRRPGPDGVIPAQRTIRLLTDILGDGGADHHTQP